jgi:hypothetical protein
MKHPLRKFKPSAEDMERTWQYKKLPAQKKLEWLDNWREFMFEVWRNNPELRKTYEEFNKK